MDTALRSPPARLVRLSDGFTVRGGTGQIGWGHFSVEVGPRQEPWIVRGDGWHSLRVDLSLASPDEIRFPGGRITVGVRDESGRALSAVGYVDDHRLEAVDGEFDLRGLPDGAYTVLIGARGHIGQVRRVVLRDGAHRRIAATLGARR